MNLNQELTYRASLGFDFILRKIIKPTHWVDLFDENKKPHNHGNWTYYLSTISLMLTASKLLGRHDIRNYAIEEFDKLMLHSFSAKDRMFLLKPNEKISQAQWNALCAIILLKLGDADKAKLFMNSVVFGLNAFEHAKTEHAHIPAHLGILIIALLQMQKKTSDKYDVPLAKANELLILSPANLHGPDVWALYFCQKSVRKLEIMSELLSESGDWLTTPMMALAQQVDLVRDKSVIVEMRWNFLFENQIDFKHMHGYDNDFLGGFVAQSVKRESNNEQNKNIRLDYVVDAIRCFLQYSYFAEKEVLLELAC